MTDDDTSLNGALGKIQAEYGIENLTMLHDDVLVLGVKQTRFGVDTGSGGPVDQPSMGISLLVGLGCETPEIKIGVGALLWFPKFTGGEVRVENKRLFIVNLKDIKMIAPISEDLLRELTKTAY